MVQLVAIQCSGHFMVCCVATGIEDLVGTVHGSAIGCIVQWPLHGLLCDNRHRRFSRHCPWFSYWLYSAVASSWSVV